MAKCIWVVVLATLIFSPGVLAESVRVATYNIYKQNNQRGLDRVFKALSSIDVWVLQEVAADEAPPSDDPYPIRPFPEKLRLALPEALQQNTLYVGLNGREGIAVASRFPILSYEIVPLNHTSSKARAALAVRLKSENGSEFLVVNTDHEVGFLNLGFFDRKKQLQSLLDYFTAHSELDSIPTLIGGDFNTAGEWGKVGTGLTSPQEIEATYGLFAGLGFQPLTDKLKKRHTFQKFIIKRELDHLLVRNLAPGKWNRFSAIKGSDHMPVWTEVELSQ